MVTPGVWPSEEPRTTLSEAEKKFYQALKRELPHGWYAWHSLRLRTAAGIEGEGDFVIAIPDRGILVLEVKGGAIEVRDGRWFQNGHPMARTPREQGHQFARTLNQRLHERGFARTPTYAIAIAFPDTAFDKPPIQDDVADCVLGGQDLPWLGDALQSMADRLLTEAWPPVGHWIETLHALWGETWSPRLKLGQKVRIDEDERIRLDAEQVRILDCIQENEHLLVEGGAGTGKTVVAREAAVRLAAGGKKVLLLCFTDALAGWLATQTEVQGVTVATVRRYALDLATRCGMEPGDTDDPAFWEQVLLTAAVDGPAAGTYKPDFIVLDEGQDLADSDWAFLGELRRDGPFWIFRDPVQAFWREHHLPEWAAHFPRFRLPQSYRCPPAVLALAENYSGTSQNEAAIKQGFRDGTLGLVACHHAGQLADKVALEIDKLLSEGLKPQDIAVISLRGQSAEGVAHLDHLGRHRLVRANDPAMEETVVGDTFLRFKGLERPAIIVTDLGLVHDRLSTRMHIALTRAQLLARIVAPADDLQRDSLLAKFCT